MKKEIAKKEDFEFGLTQQGRPRKYATPEALLEECKAYFENCKEEKLPLHVEGLCAHLNINRNTLRDYEKKVGYEDYYNVVEWAKNQILSDLVTRSMNGRHNPAGVIFNLKNNYGYTDRSEISHKLQNSEIKEINYINPEHDH